MRHAEAAGRVRVATLYDGRNLERLAAPTSQDHHRRVQRQRQAREASSSTSQCAGAAWRRRRAVRARAVSSSSSPCHPGRVRRAELSGPGSPPLELLLEPDAAMGGRRPPSNNISPIDALAGTYAGHDIDPEDCSFGWEDWRAGYQSQTQEHCYWVDPDDISGSIPEELMGTYFRNGPGRFEMESGAERCKHPFDGDGLVCAVSLKDGRVHFRSRYVETAEYLAEQQAGKRLYYGTFGTAPSKEAAEPSSGTLSNMLRKVMQKNVANTAVLFWGGKLLALWEALQPYRLDPHTLETDGLDDLNGLLRVGLPFATGNSVTDALARSMNVPIGGDPFCAHPHVDPMTGRLVAFSYQLVPSLSGDKPLQTLLTVLELDEHYRVHRSYKYELDGYGYVHDFAFTENYYIFFQNPVSLELQPFLSGEKSAAESLTFCERTPVKVHVLPRGGAKLSKPHVFQLDSCFVFHHANAFERADGSLVIDSVRLPKLLDWGFVDNGRDFTDLDFPGAALPYITLWRCHFACDPSGNGMLDLQQKMPISTRITDRVSEFPAVNPAYWGKESRYIYMCSSTHPTASQPFQAFTKVDTHTGEELLWCPGNRHFVGEPEFVPHPSGKGDEDDGWILGYTFNAASGCSELVILDAKTMTELARVKLRHHIPYALHGQFVPEYFGPTPADAHSQEQEGIARMSGV